MPCFEQLCIQRPSADCRDSKSRDECVGARFVYHHSRVREYCPTAQRQKSVFHLKSVIWLKKKNIGQNTQLSASTRLHGTPTKAQTSRSGLAIAWLRTPTCSSSYHQSREPSGGQLIETSALTSLAGEPRLAPTSRCGSAMIMIRTATCSSQCVNPCETQQGHGFGYLADESH